MVREVISRRLDALNEERLELLSECGRPFRVEDVLLALAAPSLRLGFTHPQFARLASQLRGNLDQALWNDYRARQKPVNERFRAALEEALPELSPEEASTRLQYVLGAIQHQWAHCPFPVTRTYEEVLASFMTYHLGGLRAPAAECSGASGAVNRSLKVAGDILSATD